MSEQQQPQPCTYCRKPMYFCQCKKYIITDTELQTAYLDSLSEVEFVAIRSRPHPAPRPPCEECIYQAQAAERERKAREDCIKHQRKIEDEIVHTVKLSDEQFKKIDKIFSESIKSLRSTQQQAGDQHE